MGIAGVRWWVLSSLGTLLHVTDAHAQAQAAPAAATLPQGREWVRVTLPQIGRQARIDAYEGIEDKDPDEDAAWRSLCSEPCNMWIPSGTKLRVSGDFKKSEPFTLPRSATGVSLQVKPSLADSRPLGIVLTSVGAPFLFFGSIVVANADRGSSTETTALGYTLLGLVSVGVGVGLIIASSSSKVVLQVNPGPRPASSAPTVSLGRGLWLGADGIRF